MVRLLLEVLGHLFTTVYFPQLLVYFFPAVCLLFLSCLFTFSSCLFIFPSCLFTFASCILVFVSYLFCHFFLYLAISSLFTFRLAVCLLLGQLVLYICNSKFQSPTQCLKITQNVAFEFCFVFSIWVDKSLSKMPKKCNSVFIQISFSRK